MVEQGVKVCFIFVYGLYLYFMELFIFYTFEIFHQSDDKINRPETDRTYITNQIRFGIELHLGDTQMHMTVICLKM